MTTLLNITINGTAQQITLDDPRVELVCADAIAWLAMDDGEPFDLIVDDLFGERDGIPCRAVRADADWLDLLVSRIGDCGMLTMNFAGRRESADPYWAEIRGCDEKRNPVRRERSFNLVILKKLGRHVRFGLGIIV